MSPRLFNCGTRPKTEIMVIISNVRQLPACRPLLPQSAWPMAPDDACGGCASALDSLHSVRARGTDLTPAKGRACPDNDKLQLQP